MENASKALIIAGSVLIAILLISVGIIVMNSINDPIDQATSSAESQAVEMFNSQFTAYAGEQSTTAIKRLVTKVESVKGTSEREIDILFGGREILEGLNVQSDLKSGKYRVEFGYDTEGYINKVDIQKWN